MQPQRFEQKLTVVLFRHEFILSKRRFDTFINIISLFYQIRTTMSIHKTSYTRNIFVNFYFGLILIKYRQFFASYK